MPGAYTIRKLGEVSYGIFLGKDRLHPEADFRHPLECIAQLASEHHIRFIDTEIAYEGLNQRDETNANLIIGRFKDCERQLNQMGLKKKSLISYCLI